MLRAEHSDAWVATASTSDGGEAHLVPLSFAWDGGRVILATAEATPTARNLLATGKHGSRLGRPGTWCWCTRDSRRACRSARRARR